MIINYAPIVISYAPGVINYTPRERRKYHCTVDLLFDWFEISCMTTDNLSFYLQNRLNPNRSNMRSTVQ